MNVGSTRGTTSPRPARGIPWERPLQERPLARSIHARSSAAGAPPGGVLSHAHARRTPRVRGRRDDLARPAGCTRRRPARDPRPRCRRSSPARCERLRLRGYEAPYFVAYQVKDVTRTSSGRATARCSRTTRRRDRNLLVDLRVGIVRARLLRAGRGGRSSSRARGRAGTRRRRRRSTATPPRSGTRSGSPPTRS